MKRRNFITGILSSIGLSVIPAQAKLSQQKILLLQDYIAGYQYYQGETVQEQIKINDPIQLQAEPHNFYDNKAVALYWNNTKLGYIPRQSNGVIAQMLSRGEKLQAKVQQIQHQANPWERIKITIQL